MTLLSIYVLIGTVIGLFTVASMFVDSVYLSMGDVEFLVAMFFVFNICALIWPILLILAIKRYMS